MPLIKITVPGRLYEVESGKKSPNTGKQYRDRLDQQIIPAIGELRMCEVTVCRVDRVVKNTAEKHGNAVAKMTRTVLSGVLATTRSTTTRCGTVRTIEGSYKSARALELNQAQDLRAKVAADPVAVRRDLPDFTDMMLATGLRIGETAGIVWGAVDLDAGTVELRAIVIRVVGVGLVLKPKPKSKSGYRTLELPSWAVEMLRRRRPADAKPNDPIFTAPMGSLRDPSNTNADLKETFTAADYGWVTSHVYRKTVASMMDDAGLSARAAANQLGHAKVSMTQDNYFKRKVAKTGAAKVLEAVVTPE
ncbi:site-specific integrase [Lentzea sp. NPDC004782]|uniref:site-specific integrase n=1 Tax=Lentzea sp. NPDC004782 TaxID=3154458 RepID=UPI0033B91619